MYQLINHASQTPNPFADGQSIEESVSTEKIRFPLLSAAHHTSRIPPVLHSFQF